MAEAIVPLEGRPPDAKSVRVQLDRVLASGVFARSDRLGRFLRYTVEQTLQGNGDQIKESVIGLEVYDRGADYNPKVDPIVRNEARRLRAKLQQYYESEGHGDTVLIEYPKGRYAPVFHSRELLPRSKWWKYAALLAAGLAVVGAVSWVTARQNTLRGVGTTTAIEPLSVAVLPFVNLSSDPAYEYFSDGLTEELINVLAKIEALRVLARTSSFAFKGRSLDIRMIGSKLNVKLVLEGSVRKDGDKLRVTAQLNSVANGYHLWSETYDTEMKDALAIQDRIAHAIAATLKVKLADAGGIARRAGNPEAYNLYLKGRYFRNQQRPEAWRTAVDYFSQAIEKDPNYALAYAGLSDSWFAIAGWHPAAPPEALPNAEAAAKRALEKGETLSEAHTALANTRSEEWDWAGAEKEFKRAIELQPNDAAAHRGYAMRCLALKSRLDEALLEMKRAQDLDPISVETTGMLGFLLYCARQYDQAIEQSRRALEMDPSSFGAQNMLGRCDVQKGMLANAVAEFQKTEAISPWQMHWSASLAGLYVKSGYRSDAEKLLDKWKRTSQREPRYAEVMAMLYEGLGDKEQAFRWLEIAYRAHDLYLPWIKIEPEFDGLRSDPRFDGLLRKMNLE